AGKKYHHILFRAHDDDNCKSLHRRDAPAWPDGCLLDPKRLPYSKLRSIRQHDLNNYAVLYPQEDVSTETTLVNPLWVSGGVDSDGIEYTGCWDNDRDLWELPRNATGGRGMMIATADPSPTKFWAIQCWYVNLETNFRYLMECYRQTMDAP